MANTWYYEVMGAEVGPVSSAELKKLATSNIIDRDTIVRPANGTTKCPAYRVKGLFSDGNALAEPAALSKARLPEVEVTRASVPLNSTSRQKVNTSTRALVGGLCFFALTTVVLLSLFLTSRSDTAPSAIAEQSQAQSPLPMPQPAATAAVVPQPKVEEVKEALEEMVVEPSPAPSPDVFITEIAKRLGVEVMFVQEIGDVTLLVGVKQLRAYIPMNFSYPLITGTDIGFDIRYLTAGNSIQEPSAGFIPINGNAEEVKLSSSNPQLVEVYDDGSAGVRGAGNATVFIECAGTRFSIPIQIVTTPFSVGYGKSDPKEIIAALGIPQRKQSHVVRWPQSKIIDQMYYGPDAGSQEVGEHWEYDELPGLAIRVIGSFVKGIGMRDRPPDFTPKLIRP